MIDTSLANAPSVAALRGKSPSKVNLSLEILGRRVDGFHEIRSVVLGVGLFDELDIASTDDGSIELTCDDPALPTDDTNLVVQAALALKRHCGTPDHGARIRLTKRIPVAAGLGGGSGNAAVALQALNRLWGTGLDDDALRSIGASIGSDVPLFFAMPSSMVGGRGEEVTPVELAWSGWVLLVFAGVAVSTADVYRAWRAGDRSVAVADRAERLLLARSAAEVGALCVNELEPAIFRVAPIVGELHKAVQRAGAGHARISGAGQTAYVLFDDPEEAGALRRKLDECGVGVGACVVRTLNVPGV
ncbi:MAG: 4-(cytidine 5'-diphospho)-2-C-methyl-D-erythritol kinase [Phycisphaerales bacterium]|nr:4-(cytidine 5'-diphospho)-2-C-methyl-D-erythritol kinase [Phycisphaerales bacterium]